MKNKRFLWLTTALFFLVTHQLKADVEVVVDYNAFCSTVANDEGPIPTCPSGFGNGELFFGQFQSTGYECSSNATPESARTVVLPGVDTCPVSNSATEIVAQTSAYASQMAQCAMHDFGEGWDPGELSLTPANPESSVLAGAQIVRCTVLEEDPGRFSAWKDTRVVQACNEQCVQIVEQTRSCIGGNGCVGPTVRQVERPCNPGAGMCPVNAETKGKITNNPLIQPDTPEFEIGTALENVCPSLQLSSTPLTAAQQDLLSRCSNIIEESDNFLQVVGIRNMNAEEFQALTVSMRQINLALLSNITGRLAALKQALLESGRTQSYDNTLRHPAPALAGRRVEVGGAAGDSELPDDASRWGVFLNGLIGDGKRSSSKNSSGFDFDADNITLGIDYLWDENTIFGLAIGHGASKSEFSDDAGSLENDINTLSFYGTKYFKGSWFVDGVIGYGVSDYDSRRNLRYLADGVVVEQSARGKPDGDQLFVSLGLGRSFDRSFTLDFNFRVNYINASIDRFSETMLNPAAPGFGLALEIDEQDIESLTSDIGVNISKAYSRNFGVLVPSLNLSWLHEFEDGSEELRARFVNDPFSVDFSQSGLNVASGVIPTIFSIPLDSNDSNYGRAQFNLSALFPEGLTLTAAYSRTIGLSNLDLDFYSLGLRKSF